MNALLMAISYIFVFCYTLVMLILVEVNMIWKRGNAARSTDIKGFYTSKHLMMCCVFSKPGICHIVLQSSRFDGEVIPIFVVCLLSTISDSIFYFS